MSPGFLKKLIDKAKGLGQKVVNKCKNLFKKEEKNPPVKPILIMGAPTPNYANPANLNPISRKNEFRHLPPPKKK
jgi:hypothetical protein